MSWLAAVVLVALGAGEGWFEEPLAIDDAGGRVALVHVADGGDSYELELRDVTQGGAVLARAPLGDRAPAAGCFTRGGVLVLDAGGARLIDARGRVARRIGPSRAVGFTRRDGRELVGELRDGVVRVHDLARRSPVAWRTLASLRLDAPITWRRGYTEAAGRRAGRYDAARDRRLPDREAVVDLVTGRALREGPPGDLVAAATIARERLARPGAAAFVFADGARLFGVTADDRLVALEMPAGSALAQQADGESVTFAVDDELYRWRPGAPPAHLATLPAGVAWRAAASRVVVLRPHRAFGRGGTTIEIVDTAPAQLPSSAGDVISPP